MSSSNPPCHVSSTPYKMPPPPLASLCVHQIQVILLSNLINRWGKIWARGSHSPVSRNFSDASLEIHQVVSFVCDFSIFPPCLSQLLSISKVLKQIEEDLERACIRSEFVGPRPFFSRCFSSVRAFARLYQGSHHGFLRYDRSQFPRASLCPYILSAFGSPFPETDRSPLLLGCICAQC